MKGLHPDLGEVGGEELEDQAVLKKFEQACWGSRYCLPQHVLFKSLKPRL